MGQAAPTVEYVSAPTVAPAAEYVQSAPTVEYTSAPAVAYAAPVQSFSAPVAAPVTMAAPSFVQQPAQQYAAYTPQSNLQTMTSMFATPPALQQSASMIAYPGYGAGAGGFEFSAGTPAPAQVQP